MIAPRVTTQPLISAPGSCAHNFDPWVQLRFIKRTGDSKAVQYCSILFP